MQSRKRIVYFIFSSEETSVERLDLKKSAEATSILSRNTEHNGTHSGYGHNTIVNAFVSLCCPQSFRVDRRATECHARFAVQRWGEKSKSNYVAHSKLCDREMRILRAIFVHYDNTAWLSICSK